MIGREKEIRELESAYAERESEFVAVYGRLRVGKTYLVRETFSGRLAFQHAGLKNKPTSIQLDRFRCARFRSRSAKRMQGSAGLNSRAASWRNCT